MIYLFYLGEFLILTFIGKFDKLPKETQEFFNIIGMASLMLIPIWYNTVKIVSRLDKMIKLMERKEQMTEWDAVPEEMDINETK